MTRVLFFLAVPLLCTASDVSRPRVLGVAHMALYVSDLQKARAFYEDFLGFAEPYSLKRPDGSERIAFAKINEDQYLELFAEPPKDDGRLNHLAFFTDNAAALRDYLAARGVKVPEKVGKGQIGNSNFTVSDPDGHTVEFVQYEPASWTRREKGKYMPDTRISTRMMHAGALVRQLGAAMPFYAGILGFKEFWRGSSNATTLSWVNMRVSNGDDYLELMLYDTPQSDAQRGVKNHICLVVPDVEKAVALLESRRERAGYQRPIQVNVGKNRKRQANLYDPDGTRVELMEPNTVDGQPAPSSPAPPPK
jgi:lactoylglutathione lyase